MKGIVLVCIGLLFAAAGCDGKTGPTGPAGESIEVTVITGIIPATGTDQYGRWAFTMSRSLDNAIVTVQVRPGSSYVWETPNWTQYGATVYIYDDSMTDPGFQYRIAIGL